MALSDAKVCNAKPRRKPYKIADGEGMFLLVAPTGGKYWRLKYHFAGRENFWPWVSIPKSAWAMPATAGHRREKPWLLATTPVK